MRFVTCDSVDHKTLLGVFSKDIGWDFESVAHFSVTQELTFELQTVGIRKALPLGAIIDALEFSLVRGRSLSPERFLVRHIRNRSLIQILQRFGPFRSQSGRKP